MSVAVVLVVAVDGIVAGFTVENVTFLSLAAILTRKELLAVALVEAGLL